MAWSGIRELAISSNAPDFATPDFSTGRIVRLTLVQYVRSGVRRARGQIKLSSPETNLTAPGSFLLEGDKMIRPACSPCLHCDHEECP